MGKSIKAFLPLSLSGRNDIKSWKCVPSIFTDFAVTFLCALTQYHIRFPSLFSPATAFRPVHELSLVACLWAKILFTNTVQLTKTIRWNTATLHSFEIYT